MIIDKNSEEFENNKVYSKLLKQIRTELYKGLRRSFVFKITKKDAEALEKIHIEEKDIMQIKDLTFLKFFPNIKEILISGKGSSFDIKGIRYASQLESFSANDVYIDNLTELGSCTNLGYMDYMTEEASSEIIEDFTFLRNLSNLWQLDLTGRNISDTSIFRYNKNLQQLVLDQNPIGNLEGLEELPKLEWLEISDCRLTSLDGIGNIKSLVDLFAENNKFTEEQKEMYRAKFSHLKRIEL